MSRASDEKLYEYSGEHLAYEVEMLFSTGWKLLVDAQTEQRTDAEHIAFMALLESFVIHLRGLGEFAFTDKRKYPDDVLAADFFDPPTQWAATRPACSPLLRESLKRADKEIAHLTTKRISGRPPEKVWPIGDLLPQMADILTAFVERASKQSLHPNVAGALAKVRNPIRFGARLSGETWKPGSVAQTRAMTLPDPPVDDEGGTHRRGTDVSTTRPRPTNG